MKKKLLTGVGAVAILATVGVAMFIRGTFGVDDWVVRQVVAIVETYVVPKIEFDSFDFQAPKTVILTGTTLTAPDGTKVVECDVLRLTLAQFPRRGEPLVIERIELESPTLRLVREESDEELGFKGLVPFVKRSNITNQEAVAKDLRLSSVLQIRRLSMINGGVLYDEGDGAPPMEIDGITFGMDIEPAEIAEEPGWYTLDFTLDEGSLIDLDVDGRFNLDTLDAFLNALTLRSELSEESFGALPPQIQSLMREHDARGTLEVNISGFVSVQNLETSNLNLELKLKAFNFALGEYRFPVDELTLDAQLVDGLVNVTNCTTTLLNGEFNLVRAWADLNAERRHTEFAWTGSALDLQVLLRTKTSEGEPPRLAGIVSTAGQFEMDLAVGRETIKGNGELHIVDGRLVNSPTLKALARTMDIVGLIRGRSELTDTADLIANLTPLGLEFTKIEATTDAILARGTGSISWEQQMDLSINAGPLEKLQSKLGKVGKVLGQLTDLLVTYRVTGPLGSPTVKVKPLGL